MRMTKPKEIEAVISLSGPQRVEHFIKRVVDEERAWGLWHDGWALMRDGSGADVFPLWPAAEYATLCAVDEWSLYEPAEIALEDLLQELAPKLSSKGVSPAVFPTPQGKGVIMTIPALSALLAAELEKY